MTKKDGAFARPQLRDLGRQIRILRERRGLSLNRLARQSGVSVTGIRNIELGRANSGLLTVVAILDVLGVSIDELVGMARRAGKTVFVSRASAKHTEPLQRQLSEIYRPNIRGRIVALPAATDMLTARKADAGAHFGFVIEGRLRIALGDATTRDLAAGDSFHIADLPPRAIANTGDGAARVLWVKDGGAEGRIESTIERGH